MSKARGRVWLILIPLVVPALLYVIKTQCLMLRAATERDSVTLAADLYLDPVSSYSSSRIIHWIPRQDSLLSISYLHFTPTFNAWVMNTKSMHKDAFINTSQLNLRSSTRMFLPAPLDRHDHVLLDSLMIDGQRVGYTHPPLAVVTSSGDGLMFWPDLEGGRIVRMLYGRDLEDVPLPEQELPVFCGNWYRQNLVYTLAYRGGKTSLKARQIIAWGTSREMSAIPASKETKVIFEMEAKPLRDEIGIFRLGTKSIGTIQLESDNGVQLAIIDLGEQLLIDLLPAGQHGNCWKVLKAGRDRLKLALVEPQQDSSTLYSYDPDGHGLIRMDTQNGLIRDAAASSQGGLILLSDKGLTLLGPDNTALRTRDLKGGAKLYGIKVNGKQAWVVWLRGQARLQAYSETLKPLGEIAIPEQLRLPYNLYLGSGPDPQSRQMYLNLLSQSADGRFGYMGSVTLDVLPEAPLPNLGFRLGELGSSLITFLHDFVVLNTWQLALLVLLLACALFLNLRLSRQLLQNKLSDLSGLIPIPSRDKKYLVRILELLQKPRSANAAVLNIDIVGFSSLVSDHSNQPELLRQALVDFYDLCLEQAAKNGGLIGRIMGDGITALFGWPDLGSARRNDIQKHLAGALQTARAVLERPLTVDGKRLSYRLGLAIGDVFIGYYGISLRKDYMAMGPVLELAELIQRTAPEGAICVDRNVALAVAEFGLPEKPVYFAEITHNDTRQPIYLLQEQDGEEADYPG